MAGVVVLISSYRLRAIEAKRIGGTTAIERIEIWIVGQQCLAVAVDGRGVASGVKRRFARRIGSVGIGSKVVVEGNILLKHHYQVLDGSCGATCIGAQRTLPQHSAPERSALR